MPSPHDETPPAGPDQPAAGGSGDRPLVRVIRLAAGGGALSLAATLGFGLAHTPPTSGGAGRPDAGTTPGA
jgi:hypothetical protein